MQKQIRALILDNDPDSVELLARELQRVLPNLSAQSQLLQQPLDGIDICLLDCGLDSAFRSGELVAKIRAERPRCLVVAYSAYLTRANLRRLINAGCDGAFEKGSRDELERMLCFVVEQLENSDRGSTDIGGRGLLASIWAIEALIRQWNRRLELSRTAWTTASEQSVGATQQRTHSVGFELKSKQL